MGEIALPLGVLRDPLFVGRLSSDEHLARMASRGSTRAFALLYKRHYQSLFRYCRSIVRQPEDARDALQNTMMRAFAALSAGERDLAVRPWLLRIAHNESISILRRRRRADESIAHDELPGDLDVERAVDQRERLALLLADLQALVERQRAALVMRELSGLSIEEIASALSCSPGAAKQALFEARTALHEMSEGRAMQCEAIRQAISERDGRMLRGRKLRAHLRTCAGCREFEAGIGARRADLRALLPPLPPAAGIALLRGLLASAGHRGTGALAAGNHANGATVAGTAAGGGGLTGTGSAGAGVAGTSTGGGAMLGGHLMGSLAAKALVGAAVVATAASATHLVLGPRNSGHAASLHPGMSSPSSGGKATRTGRPPLTVQAPKLLLRPGTKVHAAGATGVFGTASGRRSSLDSGGARSTDTRGEARRGSPARGYAPGRARAVERGSSAARSHGRDHAGGRRSPSAGNAGERAGSRRHGRSGESSGVGKTNPPAHRRDHFPGTSGMPTSSPQARLSPGSTPGRGATRARSDRSDSP